MSANHEMVNPGAWPQNAAQPLRVPYEDLVKAVKCASDFILINSKGRTLVGLEAACAEAVFDVCRKLVGATVARVLSSNEGEMIRVDNPEPAVELVRRYLKACPCSGDCVNCRDAALLLGLPTIYNVGRATVARTVRHEGPFAPSKYLPLTNDPGAIVREAISNQPDRTIHVINGRVCLIGRTPPDPGPMFMSQVSDPNDFSPGRPDLRCRDAMDLGRMDCICDGCRMTRGELPSYVAKGCADNRTTAIVDMVGNVIYPPDYTEDRKREILSSLAEALGPDKPMLPWRNYVSQYRSDPAAQPLRGAPVAGCGQLFDSVYKQPDGPTLPVNIGREDEPVIVEAR